MDISNSYFFSDFFLISWSILRRKFPDHLWCWRLILGPWELNNCVHISILLNHLLDITRLKLLILQFYIPIQYTNLISICWIRGKRQNFIPPKKKRKMNIQSNIEQKMLEIFCLLCCSIKYRTYWIFRYKEYVFFFRYLKK